MPVNLVPEHSLRAALRPYRVDPETFEAGVRERLEAAERRRKSEPPEGLSPRLRNAAAFLPLEILGGSKVTGIAAQMVPTTAGSKLLAYLTFPAISLFVLLIATVFSFLKVRNIQSEKGSTHVDQKAMGLAVDQWWRRHRWGALLVYAATFGLAWFGATWLLFLLFIISFGLLLYVLSSLARLGLGNRLVIGHFCLWGLLFLEQLAYGFSFGDHGIHFVDQWLVSAVFYTGYCLLFVIFLHGLIAGIAAGRLTPAFPLRGAGLFAMIAVLLGLCVVFLMNFVPLAAEKLDPILRPATPSRIKSYVESFDRAPFSTASWHTWEIVAGWAIDFELAPDLSKPHRLLAEEVAGEQNPFILGCALRLGMLRTDELGQLKDYQKQRRYGLFNDPDHFLEPQPIQSVEQADWVIRTAVLRKDLSPQERDDLQKRLHANLNAPRLMLDHGPYIDLVETLRATQLLEVIGRPVDPAQYRRKVHDWLRMLHSKPGRESYDGGFRNLVNGEIGDLQTTAHAIELMAIYGIPDGLDLNWVRSFLRPDSRRGSPEKWVAAVTLDRLNHLPGVTHPTWLDILYYERSLLAAVVLVGLCLYATLSSPQPRTSLGIPSSETPALE